MQSQQYAPDLQLWLVATSGNTLGGMTNWVLGYLLYKGIRSGKKVEAGTRPDSKSITWLRRHGSPALLLAWVPIIGDPLCLAAGWLRIHWLKAVIMIGIGKGIRYALLVSAGNM